MTYKRRIPAEKGNVTAGMLIAIAAVALGLIVGGIVLNRRTSSPSGGNSRSATPSPTPVVQQTINQRVVNSDSYKKFVQASANLTHSLSAFDPDDTRYAPPEVEVELGF